LGIVLFHTTISNILCFELILFFSKKYLKQYYLSLVNVILFFGANYSVHSVINF